MKTYQFDCGCAWPVIDDNVPEGELPALLVDPERLPSCPAVWELISRGETKGVFQLESKLGKQWAKRLRPSTLEHMSALGALLRPGCLKSLSEDGTSMTAHYCKRKNGEEPVGEVHGAISDILAPTYNVMTYQEQAMAIAVAVAGFDEQGADKLRKCVTKDTMFVSKQRGWVSIKTLLETEYDDDFLVMDEKGVSQWKKIEKIWGTGRQTVYSVNSSTGFTVRATKYHQFLTDSGWKARMRLKPEQDFLVCARTVNFEGRDELSLDQCMVIAGIATEGYFAGHNSHATFVNHDPGVMKQFIKYAESSLGEPVQLSDDGRIARLSLKQKQQVKSWGLIYGLSDNRCLPECMLGTTKETMRRFLSLILAAEGGSTVSNGQFEFSSKSRKLVDQVKLMLLRFGIRSQFASRFIEERDAEYYRLYVNTIPDQEKLLEELTIEWPDFKVYDLEETLNKKKGKTYTTDVIPQSLCGRFIDQYPYAGRHESGTAFTANLSRERFLRLAEKSSDPYWLQVAVGDQQFDLLRSVDTPQKEQETFDFTVAGGDTPYIVANGIVIHNSIGKKLPEEMAKVKKMFLTGAHEAGVVSDELAEALFGWIEKSQRYSFNRSHSYCYGLTGYDCAYLKTHFPLAFFTAWLEFAKDKPDMKEEVAELVNDAKRYDIYVETPDLRLPRAHFSTDYKTIKFGLADIKGVGEKQVVKIQEVIQSSKELLGEDMDKWTWDMVLVHVLPQITSDACVSLIKAGALDWLDVSRQRMLYEYEIFQTLSHSKKKDGSPGGERAWVQQESTTAIQAGQHRTFLDLITSAAKPKKEGGGCSNKNRVAKLQGSVSALETPIVVLQDSPLWIATVEEELLGIALSCSLTDTCDMSNVNCTVKEFADGRDGFMVLGVVIRSMRVIKTKKGKNPGQKMAFMTVEDNSGTYEECVCFPDVFKQSSDFLEDGAVAIIHVERGKDDSMIIQKVWEAETTAA